MSAFLAVCYADRVELLTDGAHYDDHGILVAIGRKVWTSPGVPLAITGRGNSDAVASIAAAVLGVAAISGSFNDTINRVRDVLKGFDRMDVVEHCEMLLTGLSETEGAKSFYFATLGVEMDPFELYEVGEFFGGGPALAEDEIAALGIRPDELHAGLRKHGPTIMDAMRRKAGTNPAKPHLPPLFGIGGHVDLTTITQLGTVTETLHVWPDEVGKKIDPAGSAITPAGVDSAA